MEGEEKRIVIIGAGLCGLTLAYLLKKRGISSTVLEARSRIGGRIQTARKKDQAPIEMGATWLGTKHEALKTLLDEVKIGIFQQDLGDRAFYEPISTSPHQLVQLPPNEDPSYRIQGGTSRLIHALADNLGNDQIILNKVVQSIKREGEEFVIGTNVNSFHADILVSTLPPHLLNRTVQVEPELPKEFANLANETHTWMGESIKVGFAFKEPFWRKKDNSGTIFSNVGPIQEMYDHSNYEDNLFALKGFLNGAYAGATKDQRIAISLDQLTKYFGPEVRNYISYEETVWSNEPYTYAPYETTLLPHQNNGHRIYQQDYMEGTFFVGGSETSPAYPGYMEGAVQSALLIFEKIAKTIYGLN